ncbi:MAG TPA: FliH/SctL family protein, partial [Oligoflexia bacterium]|nr:FliH/SctL family protein [Oligoflexia bacterium]
RSSTMVLEIALAVAEQVIGEAIEQQRGAIEKRVLRALDYAQNAGSLHITCAPADSMFLRKCLADWSAERRMITLNEDDSLGPGSFRIDTGLGVIEGFPGKHFQAISNCLNGAKDAADAWFGEQGAAAQ